MNLSLLVVYEGARQSPQVAIAVQQAVQAVLPLAQEMKDPVTESEHEDSAKGKTSLAMGEPSGKGGLRFTIVQHQEVPQVEDKGSVLVTPDPPEESVEVAETTLTPQSAADGEAMAPMLSFDSKTGKLAINQFSSATMSVDDSQCLDMGYEMLSDLGLNNDLLDVMAASEDITIAKICASNGVVMLTCRAGTLVVSPRPSRPGQQCT